MKFFGFLEKPTKNLVIGGVECSRALADAAPKIGIEASRVVAGAVVKSTTIASNAFVEGFQNAAKITAEAGKEALIESTQIISQTGKEITGIAANATVDAAQNVGVNATQIAAEAGKEIAQTVVQNIAPIAQVCAIVYAVKETAYVGMDLYEYVYPDKEKMKRIKEAEEQIAVIDARKAFRSCLMQNAKGPRNKKGFPVNCEECGQTFSMTADEEAFQKMVETFKKTY